MRKKFALLALVLIAALSLSACDGQAKASPYERYTAANKKISEAKASEMALLMDMTMYAEGAEDQAMSMQTNGIIQMSRSDDQNLEFAMSIETSTMGQSAGTDMYYKEGYMYAASPQGNFKVPMDIETAMQQVSSSEMATFPEDSIKDTKDEEKDGNSVYTFTIDGARMTEVLSDMVTQLSDAFGALGTEIAYEDLVITATIDKDDNMVDCNMIFSASITAEGQAVLVNYNIAMSGIKTDGVVIEYPEDLDTYEEIEA